MPWQSPRCERHLLPESCVALAGAVEIWPSLISHTIAPPSLCASKSGDPIGT